MRLSVGSLRHEIRFSGPGGSVNNECVTGADGTGEVLAQFGRHVLGFIRVREFAAAHTCKLHVVKNFSHVGMRLDSQALVSAVKRLEEADGGSVRKLLQVDGVGRMLWVKSRPVQPFHYAVAPRNYSGRVRRGLVDHVP
jgi:hypothetical protein